MNEYEKFLESKQRAHIISGFDVDEKDLNKNLFPFQKFIVKRALKAGKYAEKRLGIRISQPTLF